MINAEAKRKIIDKHARAKNDTGSPEVQIAIMTERIKYLTDHFKLHNKDFNSRIGLLKLVGKRRRLLDYLMKTNVDKYRGLIGQLGIRK